jgi:3-oxoacyl-[acyl-carrier protein] reductase
MRNNILIVGANSFIAKEFVKSSALAGQTDFLLASRSENAQVFIDFSQYSSIRKAAAEVKTGLDGVIFFQGINPQKNAKETTSEHVMKVLEVGVLGPILLIQAFAEKLNPGASVVFLSSVAARKGSYDPAYAAAKSAISGMMFSFAGEFPLLRFNSVSLGLVEGSPVFEGMTPDFREKHRTRMFNKQFVKAANVVRVIDELLLNDNINRETIHLDGGYIA